MKTGPNNFLGEVSFCCRLADSSLSNSCPFSIHWPAGTGYSCWMCLLWGITHVRGMLGTQADYHGNFEYLRRKYGVPPLKKELL